MIDEKILDFLTFVEEATSPFHTVQACEKRLMKKGFAKLDFEMNWSLDGLGKYYVKPFPNMLVGFTNSKEMHLLDAFRIIASHNDFPGFKIKPIPEIKTDGFMKLNTEVYGAPIFSSWMDRLLSFSGVVVLKSENVLNPRMQLLDMKRPLLTIPNLAIHLNKDVNEGVKISAQKEMIPIIDLVETSFEKENYLVNLLAKELSVQPEEILDFDLTIYCAESGCLIGNNEDMISAPRLDNLSMVYASFEALMESSNSRGINMAVCFDHEEVGSTTHSGASSLLLADIMKRILIANNRTEEQYFRTYAKSFVISADVANGIHPNSQEKYDPTTRIHLNQGVAIKYSGKQKYATDAQSAGVLKQLCKLAGIQWQQLANHSDHPGGQSLGPLMNQFLPIRTVDAGIPILAMHSAREIIGKQDLLDIGSLFKIFYQLR